MSSLAEYIEQAVLPRYAAFDKGHQRNHAESVIAESVKLAREHHVDTDMAYAIAAYHDLGLEGPRAIHHLTSGKILAADTRLQKWFSSEQIKIMKEAVEDHRASASHAPRSIYGKIVAEADRDLDPDTVFRRTVLFGLDHYPDMTPKEHWNRFYEHMQNKYSVNGYIKLWIPGSENEKKLNEIRDYIAQPSRLKEKFNSIFKDETQQD